MNDKKSDFGSVFEGIKKTREDIDKEVELLKNINAEQKEELRKAKRFNIVMAVIGVISMFVSIASLVLTIVTMAGK